MISLFSKKFNSSFDDILKREQKDVILRNFSKELLSIL